MLLYYRASRKECNSLQNHAHVCVPRLAISIHHPHENHVKKNDAVVARTLISPLDCPSLNTQSDDFDRMKNAVVQYAGEGSQDSEILRNGVFSRVDGDWEVC